ncbi:MAG: hypothetical protein R2795_11915 [Saprospiraceae bacterium]
MRIIRFFAALCMLSLASCVADQLPQPIAADCSQTNPSYSQDIQPIIETSCAYSGCHLDSSPGRFDTYQGLLPYLQSNVFRQRVITERANASTGMPPDYAPAGRPTDLTTSDLQLIECWLNAGFPE